MRSLRQLVALVVLCVLALGPALAVGGPIHSPIVSPLGASAAGPVTFSGSALGGFSPSNTVITATNQIADYRPGKTLWVILQMNGAPSSGAATIVGSYDTTGVRGWSLEVPPASNVWLISDGDEMESSLALLQGINALCLVWHADTTFSAALNGVWTDGIGSVAAPSAASATWATVIGTPPSQLSPFGRLPFAGRILAASTSSTEASQAQCQAGTFTTGNRFSFPGSITGPAVFDFNAGRDFQLGSFASKGSSPLTFATAGSPALAPVAETRYPALSRYYFDGKFAEANVDSNGTRWVARDPYSRLRGQTDATYASVEAYATMTWQPPYESIATYVNGSYSATVTFPAGSFPSVAHPAALANFALGAGVGKVVDFWEGPNDSNDYISQPYFRFGTYIGAVRLPTLLFDGTPAHSAMLSPPAAPTHRLVLLMDASMDWLASTPANTSVVALLRQTYPYPGDGITAHAASSLSMSEFALRADSVSSLVAELDGTSTNTVWIDLGQLDFRGPHCATAAAFQTAYQGVVNGLCAGKPGTHVYFQSPTQLIAPSSEAANGCGDAFLAYRAAISSIASGSCPGGCTCVYVECAAHACVSDANIDVATGAYLTDPGLAQLEGVIATTLSGAGLL